MGFSLTPYGGNGVNYNYGVDSGGSNMSGWAALGAAASGIGSALLGPAIQDHYNRRAAQKQMDFQERMRATQYQTAMKDMAAAGLNPILAYKQGGAGTPAGASSSVAMPDIAGSIGKMTSSVIQHKKLKKELDILENQDKLLLQQGMGQMFENKRKFKFNEEVLPYLIDVQKGDAMIQKYKNKNLLDHPWLISLEQGLEGIGKASGAGSSAFSLMKDIGKTFAK